MISSSSPYQFPPAMACSLLYRCIASTAAGIAAACGFTDTCTDPPENPASFRASGASFNPGRRGKVLGTGQWYTWNTRGWRLATRTKLAKNRALQISGMGPYQTSAPRVSDARLIPNMNQWLVI
ncbi:hypothetical protein F7725_025205 [Dissostichus mawsoni]|uniref:Uncharacterized protein n=1 Tax=Dissostichus mawsoni TaxID=36200 RepID=A0A7J5XAP8_DISMA|nr:hypothetical protein F7725_025205 [Dissostichus mawsoni]